jgi:hypothetical protein
MKYIAQMRDYQLVSQSSLAVMVVIWVFFLLKILESRMTKKKCFHYYVLSKWRSSVYGGATSLAVLCTASRSQFFGWVCNCDRTHCRRGCRYDLKTDALLINPSCADRLLPSLLFPAILNTVLYILWFPCFHLLANFVLHKCQPFRRPFSFSEY